jgi:hypothetical protein
MVTAWKVTRDYVTTDDPRGIAEYIPSTEAI